MLMGKPKEKIFYTMGWAVIFLIISIFLGWNLAAVFKFDREMVWWMASSIIQAFGAMLAVIMALGLHHINNISENFRRMWENLPQHGKVGTNATEEEEKDFKDMLEGAEQLKDRMNDQMKRLRERMYPALTSLLIVIAISLVMLMFAKLNDLSFTLPLNNHEIYGIALTYLVSLSFLTLYYILREIVAILDLEFR